MSEQKLYDLPEGWKWVRLEEICSKITDGTHKTPRYIENGVCFLSVKDIRERKIFYDDPKYISEEEHKELYKRCNPQMGDVLITKSGTIGRTAVVKDEIEFSLFVSVALIKPILSLIDSYFLSYGLENYIYSINIGSDIKGAVIKNFHLNDIKETMFPLAPINEQKRIVKVLNKLLSKLSQAKELVEEAKESFEKRRMAILHKAFTGELTKGWREENWGRIKDNCFTDIDKAEEYEKPPYEIPEGWKWVRLKNISKIEMGQSPTGDSYNDFGEGVPLINGPVEFGPNSFSDTVLSKWTTKPSKICKIGDLILCVRGSTLGRTNIAAFEACIGRGVCSIRAFQNQWFLNYYIHSKRQDIFSMGTGSTFPNISKEQLNNIPIPIPSINEQKEIVRILDSTLNKEEEAKNFLTLEETIILLEKGILSKAFRGELISKENGHENSKSQA